MLMYIILDIITSWTLSRTLIFGIQEKKPTNHEVIKYTFHVYLSLFSHLPWVTCATLVDKVAQTVQACYCHDFPILQHMNPRLYSAMFFFYLSLTQTQRFCLYSSLFHVVLHFFLSFPISFSLPLYPFELSVTFDFSLMSYSLFITFSLFRTIHASLQHILLSLSLPLYFPLTLGFHLSNLLFSHPFSPFHFIVPTPSNFVTSFLYQPKPQTRLSIFNLWNIAHMALWMSRWVRLCKSIIYPGSEKHCWLWIIKIISSLSSLPLSQISHSLTHVIYPSLTTSRLR